MPRDINKVIFGGRTLIDLTDTTAEQGDVVTGRYFYNAAGAKVPGTFVGYVYQEPSGDLVIVPDTIPHGPIVDTSDATALAADIMTGKTAYANGEKLVGALLTQSKSATPSALAQLILPDDGYLLSSVGVNAIPSNWNDTSRDWSWLGNNVEDLGEIYAKDWALADTDFATWTPSTTAADIIASEELTARAIDTENYEYWIVWNYDLPIAYNAGATLKAIPYRQYATLAQLVHRRPYGLTNFETNTDSYNYCASILTYSWASYMIVYNTNGVLTWTGSTASGFYAGLTAPAFSSTTSVTPNLTIKTPKLTVKCHSSYFATGRYGDIDQDNSVFKMRGRLFRVSPTTNVVKGIWHKAVDLYSNPIPALPPTT